MSIAQNFPALKPSLLLDFAQVKQLDPRITYSRASEARYYDGKTVAKAEENLLTYSQEFDQGVWLKGLATVTANTTTAPDGTSTADSFIGDGSASAHYLDQVQSANPTGRVYSVFAKAGTNNFIQIAFSGDAAPYANFDLSAGTVGSVGSNQTASIVSVGNGWYRCIVYTSSTTAANVRHFLISSSTAARGESNSLSTFVYLWGAQLEQRSTVTAYTPTTTQPITNYIPVLQTAAANVARFQHNPITGESEGFWVEEQRTNLVPYSGDFANAAWSKVRASVESNVIVAPDGTLTGDKFIEDTTANSSHVVSQGITVVNATTYTITAYAKKAERSWVRLQFGSTAFGTTYAFFDLANGVIGGQSGSPAASITLVGNGWYRISITSTSTGTSGGFSMYAATGDNVFSYTGDGYSGIYIWGAQLEAGSFPTSYIPTVASQVTRSADSASMTGANFSSWFNNAEGTFYAEAISPFTTQPAGAQAGVFIASDGSMNNYMSVNKGSNTSAYASGVIVNNAAQALFTVIASSTANQQVKIGTSYKTNDFASAGNGQSSSTDTAGTVPSVDRLQIGQSNTGGWFYNGTIKKLAFYPRRLTNAQLQALTS